MQGSSFIWDSVNSDCVCVREREDIYYSNCGDINLFTDSHGGNSPSLKDKSPRDLNNYISGWRLVLNLRIRLGLGLG